MPVILLLLLAVVLLAFLLAGAVDEMFEVAEAIRELEHPGSSREES